MSILVINCNHWIGYHVVNALLNHDYLVDGIENEMESDDLSMFFGRNSLFSFYNQRQRKQYDTCICVGDYGKMEAVKANRIFFINPQESSGRMNLENTTTILASHLFGEWMPMNKKGYYDQQAFITFDSNDFKENAIYIGDFTDGLIQWLGSSKISDKLEIKSEHKDGRENDASGNGIYISASLPLEKRVTALQQHYVSNKNRR
ncbi:hypothetical protein CWR48_11800 [Oceanobacillus arenosus]|uniref:Uncharacterized protein n=1 Tax=Oceanobacillus arenosus TaxID=1229153 RepID=A0A3D8PSK1_9BACI|nr:hypothetical protein [Oceanobacillus arenosus]RDW18261.1 hypothetical protein CWR48_11800 [Oceanobacillus arenosus]